MASYPIWNDVSACIYKSSKSYGAKDTSECTVKVGTSAAYSYDLVRHVTTKRACNDGKAWRFTFGVDTGNGLVPIVEMIIDKKTKQVLEHTILVAMGENNG